MCRDDEITARCIKEAEYYIDKQATIRQTAKAIGVSKSTVHKDFVERLPEISGLAKQVLDQIEKNKSERHIRGGNATKKKYQGYHL